MDIKYSNEYVGPLESFFRLRNKQQNTTEQNEEWINLSRHFQLTKPQQQLLKKGLSFAPTLKTTVRNSLASSLSQYHRKLKLNAYFGSTTPPQQKSFMPKSLWEPDLNKLPLELLEMRRKIHKL